MSYPYDPRMVGGMPGYGQPGMMQPGMYAPPPPGMFGATMGAFTSNNMAQQQQMMGTGGALAGSAAVGMMSGIPAMLGTGVAVGSMFAPMAMAGFGQGGGFMGALGRGPGSALGYGAFKAMDVADPFSYMGTFGGAGARMGHGFGRGMMGLSRRTMGVNTGFMGRMGAMGNAISGAYQAGGLGRGIGMAARFGGAYGMAGAGALAGAALPIGAGLAAYSALEYGGQQMYQGAQDAMMGQALMNRMGPGIAPGQNMRGQGAQTGAMMRSMATEMGTGMEDISRIAQQLNSQRVFQTTRSAKEFRDKFKGVMKAVKEIAEITQSSVDDAAKMFTDLRQQGFYTTADIKSQAASRQAREMTTGISAGVYSAIGGAGAQMARQYGMRGRYGARLAERNVAGVAQGVRSGAMSEEEVQELGGVEAVGMRMAQQQMGFMRSARGRAMIAYSMGEGGAPDAKRMQRMLSSGMSMEELVTGAAGRGLGVLRAAGGREAREQFAQYAGMGMVSMAAMQQKQLYGGTSRQGIINMMGTMGVGREEAELMLQQTLQMPKQLAAEQRERENAAERASYQSMRKAASLTNRAGAALDRVVGAPMRGMGRRMYGNVSETYERVMGEMVGGRQYTGGDEDLAAQYRAGGGAGRELGNLQGGGRLFGLDTAADRISKQYGRGLRELAQQRGAGRMEADEAARGRGGGLVRADISRLEEATRRGRETGLTEEQQARLNLSVGRGDYMQRLTRAAKQRASQTEYGADRSRGLNQLGTGASEEFAQYFAAQEAGLIGKQESFTDYTNRSVENRTQIAAQVTGAVQEAAAKDQDAQGKIIASVGAEKETGLMAMRDLQGARDSFEGEIANQLAGTLGGGTSGKPGNWGPGGSKLGPTSAQKNFSKKLTESGSARQAMSQYMQALMSGDVSAVELQRLRNVLEGELSETEMEQVKALERRYEGASAEEKGELKKVWGEGGTAQQWMGAMAYREQAEANLVKEKSRAEAALKSGDLSPFAKKHAEALRAAGRKGGQRGLEMRQQAMEGLFSADVLADGISEEEMEAFNLGGAEVGQRVAGLLEQMKKGEAGETFKGSKVTAQELEAIQKETDPEAQAELIANALKKAGLDDLAAFAMGERGTSTEGVQERYLAANEQFVTAVHAFVSSLGLSEGEMRKVQQAHSDLVSG
jgi:hypothetical protein